MVVLLVVVESVGSRLRHLIGKCVVASLHDINYVCLRHMLHAVAEHQLASTPVHTAHLCTKKGHLAWLD